MSIRPIKGILWWKPTQSEIAKQNSDYSSIFDDTFEERKESEEEAVNKYRVEGLIVYKVEVDIDELASWCWKENRPLNSYSRSILYP